MVLPNNSRWKHVTSSLRNCPRYVTRAKLKLNHRILLPLQFIWALNSRGKPNNSQYPYSIKTGHVECRHFSINKPLIIIISISGLCVVNISDCCTFECRSFWFSYCRLPNYFHCRTYWYCSYCAFPIYVCFQLPARAEWRKCDVSEEKIPFLN